MLHAYAILHLQTSVTLHSIYTVTIENMTKVQHILNIILKI